MRLVAEARRDACCYECAAQKLPPPETCPDNAQTTLGQRTYKVTTLRSQRRRLHVRRRVGQMVEFPRVAIGRRGL